MLILLLKAHQGVLFDKLVPIAGSVSSAGVITKPHFGHRKVLGEDATARPAPKEFVAKPETEAPAADAKASKKKPEKAVGDLFDLPPKIEAAAPVQEQKPKKKRAKPAAAPVREHPAEAVAVSEVDYTKPFDPDNVPEFGVPAGISKDARLRINSDAELLIDSKLEFTDEDRSLLRQYSGNGGCGASLNEFYTDPKVAAAMWNVLERLGLPDGAEVLEPSCATGVFLEVASSRARVTGVELEPTSAKIGAILHPRHTVENASLERFAVGDERQFDAVIGNAPFGLRGSLIKDDKPGIKTAEGYFLDTSVDKTKSGGIVAMIVPTGVLDNSGTRALRERLLRKAEFLGAMRMPNTAFEHSHTGVTTDVVFFRKRPQDVAGALSTVKQDVLRKLGVWDEEYLAGGYFTGRGAANVLGTMTEGWRAKAGMGEDITVEGSMIGVPEAIAAFTADEPASPGPTVTEILDAIGDDDGKAKAFTASLKRPYDHAVVGSTKMVDGVEYILQGKPPRWHRVDEFMQVDAVTEADALSQEIERLMTGGVADRQALEEAIHAYVEKHGIPSKNPDLLLAASHDKILYRLIGAVNPDGSLSDVVSNRQAAPVESTFDAAAQSLALELGDFTPEQVAARWHSGDTETVLDHLYASPDYALLPGGGWTSSDNYLSGELWPKFDSVKEALGAEDLPAADRAKFERQATLLEETIDPKSLEDVEISLNSAFLPLEVVAAFFNERNAASDNEWMRNGANLAITFDQGVYALSGGIHETGLLEKYLNRTGVRKDDLPTVDAWNAEFKQWITASKYRDRVEELYNRKFQGFRQKQYSNVPFEIPGLNTEGLKEYQYSGVRWALEAGKGIIAADVGLGKTVRGLILARMAQVTGKAKRPMIIVPKSVLANWVAEAEKWFPGSRVLVIGETYTKGKDGQLKGKQDTADERNRKLHDLTQNDYDFILISQPAWNDIDLNPETKAGYANDDFWVQRGDSLGNAGDKRLNKIRESYDQYMAGREFQKRTDAIYFDDLGVDMLIGDEFHAYKNLYAAKNRFGQAPKFLGGQGLSNRALDMNFKARWVRDHNGGKNVFGLTATPTKNSPLEIYSMLSHIAPEEFERRGIRNSEEFLDRYCEFRNENILNTRGEIEEALVTVGFKNLNELRGIMRRYMDRTTAEEVGLVLPKRDDRMHLVDMSEEQKSVYAELRELAEKSAKGKDATGDAHIFSIMDKMGKAAMDLELYDPVVYAGADSPKYHAAVEQIVEGMKDGGQVVFADNIAVHQKVVDALVKSGVPREQIAIMNAQVAASSAQRQNIADAFNKGKLKAVIGNTATMGEGQNLQKGTTDIHHMDLTWEPASIQQRNGRGLRQGNLMESVRIHSYLAKGSFDGYRYQSLLAKKDWQDLLWNGGDRVENLSREGNLSRDDMLVMLSADPESAREKMVTNKAAALQRFEAMKHKDAASDFSRFQEMSRSYSGLKKKDTPSAERLRVKIARARIALDNNKWFKAKEALDSKVPVILHPETGTPFFAGAAFENVKTENGVAVETRRFVVTSANPMNGTVRVRPYGEASGRTMHFPVDEMGLGVKPFVYSEADEKAAVAESLSAQSSEKAGEATKPKDLHGMPSAVVESAYVPLQARLKDGFRNYQWSPDFGSVLAMVSHGGEPVAAASYDAQKMLDDHDIMLPIEAHKKKAIAAYILDERAKEFRNETTQGRGRNQSSSRFVERYPGDSWQFRNRWAEAGRGAFGTDFADEAHAEFERVQGEEARHAKTTTEAIDAVVPMLSADYSGVTWPRKSLAIVWARAKREGKLDEPMSSVIPTKETKWNGVQPKYPTQLFATKSGNGRSGVATDRLTVRNALTTLAHANGHTDLAAAMTASYPDPAAAVAGLIRLGVDNEHVVAGIRHVIAKHPKVGEGRVDNAVQFRDLPPHVQQRLGEGWDDDTVNEFLDRLATTDSEASRDAA
ncbi:SNF2-related protein [Parvibaculum sp.]|uniref:SNF2-related protein n=1 Tax=Parvibaculum sp. TaxID=2024848 RepID=UPI002734224E|nr:SNF2-related protein [Parvibaculum sp.]MDP3327185.1 SNF2-related protein [Parvibaculum sp.]